MTTFNDLFEGKEELKKAFADISQVVKKAGTPQSYLGLIDQYSFTYYKAIVTEHAKLGDIINYVLYKTNADQFKIFFNKTNHDLDHLKELGKIFKVAVENGYNITDRDAKISLVTEFFHTEINKLLAAQQGVSPAEAQDPEYQERLRIIKQAEGKVVIRKAP